MIVTREHSLDFTWKLGAPKMREVTLIGRPFTEDTLNRICEWATDQMQKWDAWTFLFNLSREQIYKDYIYPMFNRSLKQNLSKVYYIEETGEIAGIACFQDPYQESVSTDKEMIENIDLLLKLEGFIRERIPFIFEKPKKAYDTIVMSMGIVDQKYAKIGIGEEGLRWAVHKHPLISRAKKIIAENEGLPGERMCLGVGMTCYWRMPYQEFEKVPGLNELTKLPKIAEKNGLNPKLYKDYTIYCLDRLMTPRL